jgi:hypothetical protein
MTETKPLKFSHTTALRSVEVTAVIVNADVPGDTGYEDFREKVGEVAVRIPAARATALAELLADGLIQASPVTQSKTPHIGFRFKRIRLTDAGKAALYPDGETAKTLAALEKFGLPKHPTATDVVDALARQASALVLDGPETDINKLVSGIGEVITPERFAILHVRAYTRLLDTFMVKLTDENPELAASLRSAFNDQQAAREAAGEG